MTYTAAERRRQVDGQYRRRYELARYRGIPTSPIPAQPTAEHVRALHDLGWSTEALSHATGLLVSNTAILNILAGQHPTMHRSTARALQAIPYSYAIDPLIPGHCLVPPQGATRRIQALMRLGWTHRGMREAYGFDTSHFARSTYRQTLARKVRAVVAMYDELCMTPGPSQKTATYARNQRWQPPLAWWDIDDPDEQPRLGRHTGPAGDVIDHAVVDRLLEGQLTPSTRGEKFEAMRRWLAAGRSERSLCVLHGWREGRYARTDIDEELTA